MSSGVATEIVPYPNATTTTGHSLPPKNGSAASNTPPTAIDPAATSTRIAREVAPRERRRSVNQLTPTMAIMPQILGSPNIDPACTRLYPRPTSKYDGNQVKTTA